MFFFIYIFYLSLLKILFFKCFFHFSYLFFLFLVFSRVFKIAECFPAHANFIYMEELLHGVNYLNLIKIMFFHIEVILQMVTKNENIKVKYVKKRKKKSIFLYILFFVCTRCSKKSSSFENSTIY